MPVFSPAIKEDAKKAQDKKMTLYFGGLNPVGGVAYGVVLSYLAADMLLATASMAFVFGYLFIR